jgi:transposase
VASDYTAADDLMALPLPKPNTLLADKGYDGDRFRENLLISGILPIIPPRSNRKTRVHPDYRRFKDRNRVERMFGKLKQQRRIATRYDKTVLSFESFLNLVAARLWLKSFVNTASVLSYERMCTWLFVIGVWQNNDEITRGLTHAICMHCFGIRLIDDVIDDDVPCSHGTLSLVGSLLTEAAYVGMAKLGILSK